MKPDNILPFLGMILLLLLGYFLWDARNEAATLRADLVDTKASLDTEIVLRKAGATAAASVQKELTALKAQKGKADAKLKVAVEAEPDWATERIPDAVRDALRVRHDED